MKKSRSSESQGVATLTECYADLAVGMVCRKHGTG